MTPQSPVDIVNGSRDGSGAGDHDVPYTFGRRPFSAATYPFSTREYARLLVLRSDVRGGVVGADDAQPA